MKHLRFIWGTVMAGIVFSNLAFSQQMESGFPVSVSVQPMSKVGPHMNRLHPIRQKRPNSLTPSRSALPASSVKGVIAPEFKMNTDSMPYNLWREDVAAAMLKDGLVVSVWSDFRSGFQQLYYQFFDCEGRPAGNCTAVDPRKSYQNSPAITAAPDGGFFIAWSESRGGYYNIYCRRFDNIGAPLDTSMEVDDYSGVNKNMPSVAANENGFVVLWHDNRSGSHDVYCRAVDEKGNLLGSAIRINGVTTNNQYLSTVTSFSDGYMAAWTDLRNSQYEIFARLLDAKGDTAGPEIKVSDTGTNDRYFPVICGTDSGSAITWVDKRSGIYNIYMQMYDYLAAPVGSNIQITDSSVNSYSSSIAYCNGLMAISWYNSGSGNDDVYAQWFDLDGKPMDKPCQLNDDESNERQYVVRAAASDSGWVFLWMDNRNSGTPLIYGQRFDATMGLLTKNFYACDSIWGMQEQDEPAVAAGKNGDFLAVWYDYRFDSGLWNICDIYGRLYDRNGNALTPDFLISDTAYSSSNRSACGPKVAGLADSSYMVAWYDSRNGSNSDIYGQRLDVSGAHHGGNYLISTGNTERTDYDLSIAAGDSGFGVAWYGYNSSGCLDIYGRVYRTNGDSVGPTITVNDITDQDCSHPSLAANDSGLIVVWSDYCDDNYHHIYAQRMLWDGSLAGGNQLIGDSLDVDQQYPSVAGTDLGFMVVWEDNRTGVSGIYGQYLDDLGQKADTNFAVSSYPVFEHHYPAVAASPDGNRYAVFWNGWNGNSIILLSQLYQDGAVQGDNEMISDTLPWVWLATWGASNIAATEDRLFFAYYGQNGLTGGDVFGQVTDWYAVSTPPAVWVDSLSDDIDSAYGPYTVNAVITDDGSVDRALLYYRINGGSWDTLSMSTVTADTFRAEIPEQFLAVNDTVNISYYVWAIDDTKNFISSTVRSFLLTSPTGVAGKSGTVIPTVYALGNAYPNPSRGKAIIRYQLPKESKVSLTIYNVVGQQVKRLDIGTKPAGYHQITWNDNLLPNGVYIYQLKAGTFTSTKKLMVVR